MKLDLTSDDPLKGGLKFDEIAGLFVKRLLTFGPELLPYNKALDHRVVHSLLARASVLRDSPVPSLRNFVMNGLTWGNTPEGHEFWARVHRSGRAGKVGKRLIEANAQRIFDESLEEAKTLASLGQTTGTTVPSSPFPKCCKANIFSHWGNGDPELNTDPDDYEDDEEVPVEPTRADLFLQFKKGAPGLNELNIAVLRKSQAEELGEDFLESIGWFRVTDFHKHLCRHGGVAVFVRNLNSTDPREGLKNA